MKSISLDSIVNDLIDETNDVYENMRPTLMEWAKKCDLRISSEYQFQRKYAEMVPTGCCLDIPCDGVHVLGIILGHYDIDCGIYFDDVFNGGYKYEEITFYDSLGLPITWSFKWLDNSVYSVQTRWHIEGNKVVFEDCLDGQDITMCYLGYANTDAKGYPLVNESHADAIVRFLKIKILEKEKHRKLISNEYINQISADIANEKKEYKRAVRLARAEDMTPTNSERNDIAAMLNNPLTGHGIYLLNNNF